MLTDLTVRQAKATGKPYTIADFDGLSLFVSDTGAKTWHFRYTWVGRRARISLGCYPELSLRDARELRDEARSLARPPSWQSTRSGWSTGSSHSKRVGRVHWSRFAASSRRTSSPT